MLGQVIEIQLLGEKREMSSLNFGIQIHQSVESANQMFYTAKMKLYLNLEN